MLSVYMREEIQRIPTASRINTSLQNVASVAVSNQTIRSTLHIAGLRARRRDVCPRLLRQHRRARREWAMDHMNWVMDQWRNCCFSDESKFNLYRPDGRTLCWRRPNERHAEKNMEAREAFGGGGLSIWGGIMFDRKTNLVILPRGVTMNAARYAEMCLEPIILPLAQEVGDQFIFMDDNARPHRARVINEFFREQAIVRMNWPARSPDMNQ